MFCPIEEKDLGVGNLKLVLLDKFLIILDITYAPLANGMIPDPKMSLTTVDDASLISKAK